jgi:hypothetical protein
MARLSKSVPSRTGDDMIIGVRHDMGFIGIFMGLGGKAKRTLTSIALRFLLSLIFLFNIQGIVWGEMGRDDIDRAWVYLRSGIIVHTALVCWLLNAVVSFPLHCCLSQ